MQLLVCSLLGICNHDHSGDIFVQSVKGNELIMSICTIWISASGIDIQYQNRGGEKP
jgi:hypothetical protein